eukprot:gnl/MRDRNA2_/MRDRNA2_90719_c0_seq1.p1 gnl/MRDRNA2_/MRDRNA2_90719_c0~~gnl/MRDRNA2_/MRDRNA2_90719_c0_seq1.p1  ORF type:complete len:1665 (+),score=499.79 gnl/MRDRNA2_/MRDRNA2_90719_c0_seq1:321-4997(+)
MSQKLKGFRKDRAPLVAQLQRQLTDGGLSTHPEFDARVETGIAQRQIQEEIEHDSEEEEEEAEPASLQETPGLSTSVVIHGAPTIGTDGLADAVQESMASSLEYASHEEGEDDLREQESGLTPEQREQVLKDMCDSIVKQQQELAAQAANIENMAAGDKLKELAKLEKATKMDQSLSEDRRNQILSGISASTEMLQKHREKLGQERKRVNQARIAAWKSGTRALALRKAALEENLLLVKGSNPADILEREARRRELNMVEDTLEEMQANADDLYIEQAEESAREAVGLLRSVRQNLKDANEAERSQPLARRRLTTVENKAATGFVEVQRAKLDRLKNAQKKLKKQAQRQAEGLQDFRDWVKAVAEQPSGSGDGDAKGGLPGFTDEKQMLEFLGQLDPKGKLQKVVADYQSKDVKDPALLRDMLIMTREEVAQEAQDSFERSKEAAMATEAEIEEKELHRLQRQLDIAEDMSSDDEGNTWMPPVEDLKAMIATRQAAKAKAVLELEVHKVQVLERQEKFAEENMRVKVAEAEATGDTASAQKAKEEYEAVKSKVETRRVLVEEARIDLEVLQIEAMEAGIDLGDVSAEKSDEEEGDAEEKKEEGSSKESKVSAEKPVKLPLPHKSPAERKKELEERKKEVVAKKVQHAKQALQNEEVQLMRKKQQVENLEDEMADIKKQLAELEEDDEAEQEEDEASDAEADAEADAKADAQLTSEEKEERQKAKEQKASLREEKAKAKEEKRQKLLAKQSEAEKQIQEARETHRKAIHQYEDAKKEVKTLKTQDKSKRRVRVSLQDKEEDGHKSDSEAEQMEQTEESHDRKGKRRGKSQEQGASGNLETEPSRASRELIDIRKDSSDFTPTSQEFSPTTRDSSSEQNMLATYFERWKHLLDVYKRMKRRQTSASVAFRVNEENFKKTYSRESMQEAHVRRRQTLMQTRRNVKERIDEEMHSDMASGVTIANTKNEQVLQPMMVDKSRISVIETDERNMSLTGATAIGETSSLVERKRKSIWQSPESSLKLGPAELAKVAADLHVLPDAETVEMTSALEQYGLHLMSYNVAEENSRERSKDNRKPMTLSKLTSIGGKKRSPRSGNVSKAPKRASSVPPEGEPGNERQRILNDDSLAKKGWTKRRRSVTPPGRLNELPEMTSQRSMARTISGTTLPQNHSVHQMGASASAPFSHRQFRGIEIGSGLPDDNMPRPFEDDSENGILRSLLRQPSARGAPATPEARDTPPSATGSSPTPSQSLRSTGERWRPSQLRGSAPEGQNEDMQEHPVADMMSGAWEEMSRSWTPPSEVSDMSRSTTATPGGLHESSDYEPGKPAPHGHPWILQMASRSAAAKVYFDIAGSKGWKDREMGMRNAGDEFQLPPISTRVTQPMSVHPNYAEAAAQKAHDLPKMRNGRGLARLDSESYLKRRSDEMAAQYGLKPAQGWEKRSGHQSSQTSTQAPSSNTASTTSVSSSHTLPVPPSKGSLSVASIWEECLAEVKPQQPSMGGMSKYALTLVDVEPPFEDSGGGIVSLPTVDRVPREPKVPKTGRGFTRADRVSKPKLAVLGNQ